jgi:hypothetical protein
MKNDNKLSRVEIIKGSILKKALSQVHVIIDYKKDFNKMSTTFT